MHKTWRGACPQGSQEDWRRLAGGPGEAQGWWGPLAPHPPRATILPPAPPLAPPPGPHQPPPTATCTPPHLGVRPLAGGHGSLNVHAVAHEHQGGRHDLRGVPGVGVCDCCCWWWWWWWWCGRVWPQLQKMCSLALLRGETSVPQKSASWAAGWRLCGRMQVTCSSVDQTVSQCVGEASQRCVLVPNMRGITRAPPTFVGSIRLTERQTLLHEPHQAHVAPWTDPCGGPEQQAHLMLLLVDHGLEVERDGGELGAARAGEWACVCMCVCVYVCVCVCCVVIGHCCVSFLVLPPPPLKLHYTTTLSLPHSHPHPLPHSHPFPHPLPHLALTPP